MTPYEIMLSESQERMLIVAKQGREAEVLAIFEKWDLDAAVIGRVTDTGRWVVPRHARLRPARCEPIARDPRVVVDMPIPMLVDEAPRYDRPATRAERDPIEVASSVRARTTSAPSCSSCCARRTSARAHGSIANHRRPRFPP